jgi:hypothetical protein
MARFRLAASLVLLAACQAVGPVPVPGQVQGTWGGDNAGLIAGDSSAHVHIGCTFGDTRESLHIDANGRFDQAGVYDVDAYPVSRGITHPARFTGTVIGRSMVLTVTLSDTARQLGPVVLTYGVDPKMGPCPICRTPPSLNRTGRASSDRHTAPGGVRRPPLLPKEN